MYVHAVDTVCSEYEAPAAAVMRNIILSLCIVIRWISYMKCISKVLNKMFTGIPAMRLQSEVIKTTHFSLNYISDFLEILLLHMSWKQN
jgi:hypothetical protein